MNLERLIKGLAIGCYVAFGWTHATAGEPGVKLQFRVPRAVSYIVQTNQSLTLMSVPQTQWLKAWPDGRPNQSVELGNRVVLQLRDANQMQSLLFNSRLVLSRTIAPNLMILQAPDCWTAVNEAARLARMPGVLVSTPVKRQKAALHGPYAFRPYDTYFNCQWNLENRDPRSGASLGADLNVRAAWPYARGEGVTIAIVDDGMELTHPELAPRQLINSHHNFHTGENNGDPSSTWSSHGTAVAGLAAAEGYNERGMIGVAYEAQLASWVIFSGSETMPSDEFLADMFQYQSNIVSIQNHSWGNSGTIPLEPSYLEQSAISNAVINGRNGLGVVIVRSGGNGRKILSNANDDGYIATPQTIAVAAIRADGRAASYSNPGANLLVAAPSGDSDAGFPLIFTTDLQGRNGLNSHDYTNDLADYTEGAAGFSGTSASAPQISGVCALILSANPNLGYRDVQQILIFSSSHLDLADPDLTTNGAGFVVSHNVGFGVPDAGMAVSLTKIWKNRPAVTNITFTSPERKSIPDAGFRVLITGENIPDSLTNVYALPGEGRYPDDPTAELPLAYVGVVTSAITNNLTGMAALIQWDGSSYFYEKINRAAKAGAAFAVFYNNKINKALVHMKPTEYAPIPSAFISKEDGDTLVNMLQQNRPVQARLKLDAIHYDFEVTNTLILEHVGVRIATDHPSRADLRITLLSPQGTRSVLGQYNNDTSPGPAEWTYYSTHHFYESSAGTWRVTISDEQQSNIGTVSSVDLVLLGVPITDRDHDGLDDQWEMSNFNSLDQGPKDDPDGDGYSNAREQILGANPLRNEAVLQIDMSRWSPDLLRLSWPGLAGQRYEIWRGGTFTGATTLITNMPGRFPITEWFASRTNLNQQYFRVRSVPSL